MENKAIREPNKMIWGAVAVTSIVVSLLVVGSVLFMMQKFNNLSAEDLMKSKMNEAINQLSEADRQRIQGLMTENKESQEDVNRVIDQSEDISDEEVPFEEEAASPYGLNLETQSFVDLGFDIKIPADWETKRDGNIVAFSPVDLQSATILMNVVDVMEPKTILTSGINPSLYTPSTLYNGYEVNYWTNDTSNVEFYYVGEGYRYEFLAETYDAARIGLEDLRQIMRTTEFTFSGGW
jgi:hypothetical protein